ncbi:MAG: hypothetical protein P4M11_07045, partial [Candidatus Pacebacteria bacterium]|nr:hypothetical protein [Candidatus Paceibacterota bacterium]
MPKHILPPGILKSQPKRKTGKASRKRTRRQEIADAAEKEIREQTRDATAAVLGEKDSFDHLSKETPLKLQQLSDIVSGHAPVPTPDEIDQEARLTPGRIKFECKHQHPFMHEVSEAHVTEEKIPAERSITTCDIVQDGFDRYAALRIRVCRAIKNRFEESTRGGDAISISDKVKYTEDDLNELDENGGLVYQVKMDQPAGNVLMSQPRDPAKLANDINAGFEAHKAQSPARALKDLDHRIDQKTYDPSESSPASISITTSHYAFNPEREVEARGTPQLRRDLDLREKAVAHHTKAFNLAATRRMSKKEKDDLAKKKKDFENICDTWIMPSQQRTVILVTLSSIEPMRPLLRDETFYVVSGKAEIILTPFDSIGKCLSEADKRWRVIFEEA